MPDVRDIAWALREQVCAAGCVKKNVFVGITTDDPAYRTANHEVLRRIGAEDNLNKVHILDCSSLLSGFSYARYRERVGSRYKSYHEQLHGKTGFQFEKMRKSIPFRKHSWFVEDSSLLSDLHSFFCTDKLPRGPLRSLIERELVSAGHVIGTRVEQLFSAKHFCVAITLNGRHVPSKTISKIASKNSIPTIFWELGSLKGNLYICDHPSQDFYAFEREFEPFRSRHPDLQNALEWVTDRQLPTSTSNIFGSRWDFKYSEISGSKEDIDVLLATSSQDEFWSLGNLFPAPKYKDQYLGFSDKLNSIRGDVSKAVLRMHPNTLNKSPGYCLREAYKVWRILRRYSSVLVVWPQDEANTYSLVRRSKIVIVANSTLGVEAMAMGKRTQHLNASVFATASKLTLGGSVRKTSKRSLDLMKRVALTDIALQLEHESKIEEVSHQAEPLGLFQTLLAAHGPYSILRAGMAWRNRVVARFVFSLSKKILSSRSLNE